MIRRPASKECRFMPTDIIDRILADIKTAMKARDKDRLLALRFLHSEIKNAAIGKIRL